MAVGLGSLQQAQLILLHWTEPASSKANSGVTQYSCAQMLCNSCSQGDGTGAALRFGRLMRVLRALAKLDMFATVFAGMVTFGSGHCRIMVDNTCEERSQERKTGIGEKERQQC